MKDRKTITTLEEYLSQVDRYLKHISVSEKVDILNELKNSFYERKKSGQSEEAIIAEMESPKALALSYLGESVVRDDRFSWKNFMLAFGFYSYASLAWVAIIPTLAVLAVSFFLSSGVSVLAGVLGLIKGAIHIPFLEDFRFIVFMYELKGLPALLVGLLLAMAFLAIGILCWKGTVGMIRLLQTQRWTLKSKANG